MRRARTESATSLRRSADRSSVDAARTAAQQAFSRAAGAPLISGNSLSLLIDAAENYPAWLNAIAAAAHHVHFENYIFRDDSIGHSFADALIARARQGVRVRVIYDWLGGFPKTSRRFWDRLRAGGVEVRCYNPPHFYSPVGWLSRDHRKMLAVDGEVGFISGLCVGKEWTGAADRGIEAWRDTGVEIRGPAVADIERAFAQVWTTMGAPIPDTDLPGTPAATGTVSLRVVATLPATTGLLRLDQLVVALARQRVWLTDAYFVGTTPYVQTLTAAARDGVDVRLLVPNATDIPLMTSLSRTGYRPLLEAGVRVFEWNGTMMHAKTSVADGRWARVGSTNLNIASWWGNCELDAVIEDEDFASRMEEQYLRDLTHCTEVVLDARRRLRAPGAPRHRPSIKAGGGSAGRAATGAIRISHAVGAAFGDRRVLEPLEARVVFAGGLLLLGLAVLFAWIPQTAAYPLAAVLGWWSIALVYRGYRLRRERRSRDFR